MFKKIMVATDGSENAASAVAHAAALARSAGAEEVTVLHMCPACTADLDPHRDNQEFAQRIVREASETFADTGADVRIRVEVDYTPEDLARGITDIAREEGVDTIVLGSRGLSGIRGMLLGSVSSKVLQLAHCPVLVVKQPENNGGEAGGDDTPAG